MLRRDGPEPGHLTLPPGIAEALRLLDEAAAELMPGSRAVLVDDGERLVLTSYVGAERLAVIELSPLRAVALAGELIAAGLRGLSR